MKEEPMKEMTNGEIYNKFIQETGIRASSIEDYRPCCEFFGVPDIPNAILIWLKIGEQIIYIHKN